MSKKKMRITISSNLFKNKIKIVLSAIADQKVILLF